MEKRTKQRTCIECRTPLLKQELIRIVRAPDGVVKFDSTGKANGRGAYVCSLACLEKALKTHKFDRALRMGIDKDTCEEIASSITSFFANSEAKSDA